MATTSGGCGLGCADAARGFSPAALATTCLRCRPEPCRGSVLAGGAGDDHLVGGGEDDVLSGDGEAHRSRSSTKHGSRDRRRRQRLIDGGQVATRQLPGPPRGATWTSRREATGNGGDAIAWRRSRHRGRQRRRSPDRRRAENMVQGAAGNDRIDGRAGNDYLLATSSPTPTTSVALHPAGPRGRHAAWRRGQRSPRRRRRARRRALGGPGNDMLEDGVNLFKAPTRHRALRPWPRFLDFAPRGQLISDCEILRPVYSQARIALRPQLRVGGRLRFAWTCRHDDGCAMAVGVRVRSSQLTRRQTSTDGPARRAFLVRTTAREARRHRRHHDPRPNRKSDPVRGSMAHQAVATSVSDGTIRPLLRCTSPNGTTCRGSVRIDVRTPGGHRVSAGRASFVHRAGSAHRVTIRLCRAIRRAARRRTLDSHDNGSAHEGHRGQCEATDLASRSPRSTMNPR